MTTTAPKNDQLKPEAEFAGNPTEQPFADQCKISAKGDGGTNSAKDIESLLTALRRQIQAFRNRWGFLLPRSWLGVKAELERLRAGGEKAISRAHFERICQQHRVAGAATLLGYLHDTGFLYHRGELFSDQVILNQNWFIDAVYKLLDPRPATDSLGRRRASPRERIRNQRGEFSGMDARDYWEGASDAECERYLDFMRQAALLFEVTPGDSRAAQPPLENRRFVLPNLLPSAEDSIVRLLLAGWPPADCWAIELEYGFLPRTLLDGILARLHPLSPDKEWWDTGMRFIDPDTQGHALVRLRPADGGRGFLHIELEAPQAKPGNAARLSTLQRLLALLKELKTPAHQEIWVSPNARGGDDTFVSLSDLNRSPPRTSGAVLVTRARTAVPAEPYWPFVELLRPEASVDHEPGARFRITHALPPALPIRLFISYAHADAEHLTELKKRLKALRRVYEQLEVWDDTQLIGGQRWEEAILGKLNAADIVCLLVSPDFMSSDYCFDKELPPALAKYEQSGGVPVPIIIRETPSWTDLRLAEHQALPQGAKPIEDWSSSDKFWGAVETGLKAVVEKLAANARRGSREK